METTSTAVAGEESGGGIDERRGGFAFGLRVGDAGASRDDGADERDDVENERGVRFRRLRGEARDR